MKAARVAYAALAVLCVPFLSIAQKERVYLAPDDHTDYVWTADEVGYRNAMLQMTDYYLDLTDKTIKEPKDFQSRWNLDGALWMQVWEKNRDQKQVSRLVERLKDGHFSMPITYAVSTYGGMPTEAVLRSMYYAGSVERRYKLHLDMALAMEDQTLPNGLGALWAGSGARYSWRGVCSCATQMKPVIDQLRTNEIYWWRGPDSSRVLMKWYSLYKDTHKQGDYQIGTYLEAADPTKNPDIPLLRDPEFRKRYPYHVVGIFGEGGDNLSTMNDNFPKIAKRLSTPAREVVVSNEEDFFRDFERRYGKSLPQIEGSFGNEWDMYSASMQEVSSSVRRATEKLRSAETLETLVSVARPEFPRQFIDARDRAWTAYGLFWEHDWTADNPQLARSIRAAWQRRISQEITSYVDTLFDASARALGGMIKRSGNEARFFVLNPLNWERTDVADLPYTGSEEVHVVDLQSGNTVPSQFVEVAKSDKAGARRVLRIVAAGVPSIGYKIYEVRAGKQPDSASDLIAKGSVIENTDYRVTLTGRGAISSFISKSLGGQELAAKIEGREINDLGDGAGTVSVTDAGPVSVTLQAKATGPVPHTTEVTLYRGINRVTIRNEITAGFSDVKTWAFSFNLRSPDVWHEELGAINHAKVKPDGDYFQKYSRLDWLTLNHFVAMSGYSRIGITLSNSDDAFMKLGKSKMANGIAQLDSETPQISVLAGGQVDGPSLGIPDQGGDTYFLQRFALRAQANFNAADSMRFSLEDQNPLVTGEVTGGSDYPETAFSFLQTSPSNVMLWALKPHEDGIEHGIITRFWNVSPESQDFSLKLANGIAKAFKSTHIETEPLAAEVISKELPVKARSWQMLTYVVQPGKRN